MLTAIKIGSVLTALDIAYAILSGSIFVPVVAGFFWKRANWQGAVTSMLISSVGVDEAIMVPAMVDIKAEIIPANTTPIKPDGTTANVISDKAFCEEISGNRTIGCHKYHCLRSMYSNNFWLVLINFHSDCFLYMHSLHLARRYDFAEYYGCRSVHTNDCSDFLCFAAQRTRTPTPNIVTIHVAEIP